MVGELPIGKNLERSYSGRIDVLSSIYLEGMNTITKYLGIAVVPANIRTQHLPNASLESFLHTNLFDVTVICLNWSSVY
jgi:hypothetical protein